MKMGDDGFRPAYNAQYATDDESQVVVGAEVVTVGSDQGQLVPMIGQVAKRCGKCPEQWLVDGGYNVQRGRFGCRDGLSSMKTPISEQKRPPQRRIGITPPAGEISNARRACAPLSLSNSENRLLHRL